MTGSPLLIVIPTLNEAQHIAAVLDSVLRFPAAAQAKIVVVDGGSRDATCDIVRNKATADPRIHLIDNPRRIQAAAVNLAVARFGDDAVWLMRLDAHSHYPHDFADTLLAEAERTGADSVVVSMDAQGQGFWQRAIAAAQNSRLGNGGSAHRLAGSGDWVRHGHHALMRIQAFRSVGGYDETFTHNEDAELDHRLIEAGFRIWLTGQTRLTYFPRSSLLSLMRQYQAFGRGRRRNLTKHAEKPGMRQAVVALLAPAMALAVLSPLAWIFALPLLGWLAICIVGGAVIAATQRSLSGLPAGFFAGAMHLAWSFGFWREWLSGNRKVGP
ncbi:glycosyltransferase family 2 protein [Paracoccus sp. (in: a-proteobacteria)]|uniref:glycosyltransferase family 2 protein n=1 Tax=Paracoccus sp. TaxID=267 RepID=UPI00396CD1F1